MTYHIFHRHRRCYGVSASSVSGTIPASGSAGFLRGLRSLFGVEGSRTWQRSVAPGRGGFRTDPLHEGRRSGDAWTRCGAGPLGSGYAKRRWKSLRLPPTSSSAGQNSFECFCFAYRSRGKKKPTVSLFSNSTKASLTNSSSLMSKQGNQEDLNVRCAGL